MSLTIQTVIQPGASKLHVKFVFFIQLIKKYSLLIQNRVLLHVRWLLLIHHNKEVLLVQRFKGCWLLEQWFFHFVTHELIDK